MSARGGPGWGGAATLLAAVAIASSTVSVAACGAGEAVVERTVAASAAPGDHSASRSFAVANVVPSPKFASPPVPPFVIDEGRPLLERILSWVQRLLKRRAPVPALPGAPEIPPLAEPQIRGLTKQETWQVIKGACVADSLIKASQAHSPEEAATKAMMLFGGRAMLYPRILALTKEITKARTSTDRAAKTAELLLCETPELRPRSS